jgi:hypothetical protein
MLNVVDGDSDQLGNLDDLTKSLREEAAVLTSAANQQQAKAPANAEQAPPADVDLPEKFRGKSVKEVVEAYKQLESLNGRMANDLGTQRVLTDRLLNLRRDNDLRQNGAGTTQPETPKIKATDLAEDPTGAIEKVVNARLGKVQQDAAQEASEHARNAAAARLVQDHPDYQEYVNNPEFTQFINGSPIRKRAAVSAQQGDFDAGNDLLTEFKAQKKQKMNQQDDNKNLDAARSASLESGARGGDGSSKAGKVYSRADLLRLQLTNPEVYYSDEYQAVIMKAYAEKRVK